MAVYNQVSKPNSPNDQGPDDPNDKKINSESSHESRNPEVTHIENEGTRMDHNVLSGQWHQVSEPTHFTAASSPTRKRDFA